MTEQILTQQYLSDIFIYKNGDLYWKIANSPRIKINDKAGTTRSGRYAKVKINNKRYYVHRIVYLMHYGYLPKFIDHIDTNTYNNSIDNLREVTQSQNIQNSKLRKDNTSGVKNVYWHKSSKKWVVCLNTNGKFKHFGSFICVNEAKNFVTKLRKELHGEYANHG